MLGADQIEAFRRDGYLVVPDLVPADLLATVRKSYATRLSALCKGWGLPPGGFEAQLIAAQRAGHDWFQPLDISLPGDRIHADTPMFFDASVFDLITCNPLLDLVEALIGPEITSNPIQHVRLKPPAPELAKDEARAHVTATDWHQDRAVARAEADQTEMITVWLAVTDATLDNGCLTVRPKTTRTLPHCPKRQTAIADGFVDESLAIPLPVRAGGAVILHPLTPHASRVNRSDGIRWSFDLRYNVTGQPTGRNWFPDFVARSRARPETELHNWQVWRDKWEDARARLAQAPHIDIHRWTSDAPYCA